MTLPNPDQTPIDPDTGQPQEPSLPDPGETPPGPDAPDEGLGAGQGDADVLIDPDLSHDDPEQDGGGAQP